MNESCHAYESVTAHTRISLSRTWKRHFTHMNKSRQAYEWVMSHIWMSHVTHVNESCHTYEWVILHIWISHVRHMNGSCHTWMSHVTHTYQSRHVYKWVMTIKWISHVAHTHESCHTTWMSHVVTHDWFRESQMSRFIAHSSCRNVEIYTIQIEIQKLIASQTYCADAFTWCTDS